jgi:glycosyltransferase involved in cell wall biosynthesis
MANIALVTDWITKEGGGEKVVEQFHLAFPEAPIYTSYCEERRRIKLDHKVVTGYLQYWPFSKLRRFLPVLRQWWFARLDLSKYEIVISITGNGEAKFVRTNSSQVHISYCHTPVHFYWAQYGEYVQNPSMRPKWLARLGLKLLVKPLRKRDFAAAQRVDYFIANSTAIQQDIRKYYQKESVVIHPPIVVDNFMHIKPAGEKSISEHPECIWWGRVVPAKRLDIVIEACNSLGWPLTIIGDGPDLPRLKTLAGPTVTFTGYISDETRLPYIKKAELFLFPSKEDFGVAPVEALAAGVPLVAYKAGGVIDYLTEGESGVFFTEQTPESLVATLQKLPGRSFAGNFSAETTRFDAAHFRTAIQQFVATTSKGDRT